MERHLSAAEKLPVLPVSVRHLSAAQKVQPAAINGLRGNSFTGTKLVVKPTARASEPKTSGVVLWWPSTETRASTLTLRIWATLPGSGICMVQM
ncbi:hypothetical protein ACFX13_028045 [Malus domestica]